MKVWIGNGHIILGPMSWFRDHEAILAEKIVASTKYTFEPEFHKGSWMILE